MSVLSSLFYRFNKIAVKIQQSIFWVASKVYMERQKTQNNQYNLKENRSQRTGTIVFKTYWKARLTKAVCVWYCERIDKYISETCQVALLVKNLPGNTGDTRDAVLIPGLGRSLGEGNGNSLKCSCLENSMDRGAGQSMRLQRVRHDWAKTQVNGTE